MYLLELVNYYTIYNHRQQISLINEKMPSKYTKHKKTLAVSASMIKKWIRNHSLQSKWSKSPEINWQIKITRTKKINLFNWPKWIYALNKIRPDQLVFIMMTTRKLENNKFQNSRHVKACTNSEHNCPLIPHVKSALIPCYRHATTLAELPSKFNNTSLVKNKFLKRENFHFK
jgi:hypothetical protein